MSHVSYFDNTLDIKALLECFCAYLWSQINYAISMYSLFMWNNDKLYIYVLNNVIVTFIFIVHHWSDIDA